MTCIDNDYNFIPTVCHQDKQGHKMEGGVMRYGPRINKCTIHIEIYDASELRKFCFSSEKDIVDFM